MKIFLNPFDINEQSLLSQCIFVSYVDLNFLFCSVTTFQNIFFLGFHRFLIYIEFCICQFHKTSLQEFKCSFTIRHRHSKILIDLIWKNIENIYILKYPSCSLNDFFKYRLYIQNVSILNYLLDDKTVQPLIFKLCDTFNRCRTIQPKYLF